VTYKGLEGQVAYAFERGFSVYANGSANSAKSKATSLQIAGVPDTTAAFGVMYKSGGWSGSFVNKRVGRTFALDDEGYKLDPYSTTDLSLAYTFDHPGLSVKTLKLQGGIYNLANNQAIVTVKPKNTTAGATYGVVNAADTFQFQPTRSFMLTARADF
jgi:iron complex outermembrane receptor protein